MDKSFADKIAELCDIQGVDHIYYIIIERHKSGETAIHGILQHINTVNQHVAMIRDMYEYAEIVDKPEILICPILDAEDVAKFTREMIHKYIDNTSQGQEM